MIPASNKSSTGTVADICSDYLCGLCPYDLLKNTTDSPGSCSKVHSDEAKYSYIESLSTKPSISVMNDHLRSLEGFLAARDLKVKKAKSLLHPPLEDTDETKKMKDQIEKYELEISKYELWRDTYNQDYLRLRDHIKSQSNICERLYRKLETRAPSKQYQIEVCEVCGCYIDQGLSDERKYLHENSEGVHSAYNQIASKVAEIKNSK